MNKKAKTRCLLGDVIGCIAVFFLFIIPFLFILLNSLKDQRAANLLNFTLPDVFQWRNYLEVLKAYDYLFLTSLKNSLILTFGSVILLILTASMAGYILQRRRGRAMSVINFLIMSGLMIPPAILPTIWIMQALHIYKSLFSMILIETAIHTPFTVMLYRGFMAGIPLELEEAAHIDGCGKLRMFFNIIFPLLKPVTSTVIILNAVAVFNDFMNPLYFLPGAENSTIQLTLYTFMGMFSNSYNLVFADVVLITLPMLFLFLLFNKQIVNGMVAGSVKG
ncbi:carbohydrate ABC transporter permease [Diplocloster hominis]|uniref:carbohydrate ABC transporter permease n=1 Tax=Diplocloster hominis TaxID=3079010 RepID=UPI0031BBB651